MTHRIGLASVALVLAAAPLVASPAHASGGIFDNCTAFNEKFPHGVGRKGAKDKTTSKRVTNFRVDNTLYGYNDGGAVRHRGEYDLDRVDRAGQVFADPEDGGGGGRRGQQQGKRDEQGSGGLGHGLPPFGLGK